MELEALSAVVVTAVAVFLCGLIGSGIAFLRTKNKEVAQSTKNTLFFGIVSVVSETIDDVLEGLGATMIEEIKEKAADGQITKEEIVEIVDAVKEKVGYLVSENLQLDLMVNFIDDWDEWLEAKIIAAVNKFLKIEQAA